MTLATAPERRLIIGAHDPDEAYPVPAGLFAEFTEAPDLAEIGHALMKRHFEFFPEELTVDFVWKAAGTKKADAMCVPLKGIAGYYSHADYMIWVAADKVDENPYSRYQVEAMLFHELKHIDAGQGDEGIITNTHPHELEVFRDELEHYGFWRSDRLAVAQVVQRVMQRTLPGLDSILPDVPIVKRPGGEAGQLESRRSLGDADDLPAEEELNVSFTAGEETVTLTKGAAAFKRPRAARAAASESVEVLGQAVSVSMET